MQQGRSIRPLTTAARLQTRTPGRRTQQRLGFPTSRSDTGGRRALSPSLRRGADGAGERCRQGFLAAATNPRGLLFFSAFLPQFIDPQRSLWMPFLALAATYAGTESLVEYARASAVNRLRPWLRRVGRRFNRACGGAFVTLGAALPVH